MESLKINRKWAKETLIYDAHWKDCICETLRSIYDDLHDYPDKELAKKITRKLVTGMIMATKMQERNAYLAETYNDMTGHRGTYLQPIPEWRENKKRRRARMKNQNVRG